MKQNHIKSALIIGGSDGIGLRCAEKLKQKDCKIINISRGNCACADENLYCDIAEGNIGQIVGAAFGENPDISIVLYCAGCSLAAPVEFVTEDDFYYLFMVNFFGFCNCVKAAIPYFKLAGGGYIGAVSSLGASVPIAFDAYYSASKAALDMFVREVGIELAPYGIKIAGFRPGGVATDFTFKRKIYDYGEVGSYASDLESAVHKLATIEQNGDTPDKIADFIITKIEKGKGGVFTVGFLNRAFAAVSVALPTAIADRFTKNLFT